MKAPGQPLVVVFNIGAGHGQADEVRATLQAGCAEAGRTLHLLEVQDPRRLGAIARQAVAQAQPCGGIVVVVHQPLAVTRPEDVKNLLHGNAAALQAWGKAGVSLIVGGHIHRPFVLPLARGGWAVLAGRPDV